MRVAPPLRLRWRNNKCMQRNVGCEKSEKSQKFCSRFLGLELLLPLIFWGNILQRLFFFFFFFTV